MRSDSLPRRAGVPASLAAQARLFLGRLALRRQRRRLAELDDHMLRDIGLSREEALREASRGWGAPDHWRR